MIKLIYILTIGFLLIPTLQAQTIKPEKIKQPSAIYKMTTVENEKTYLSVIEVSLIGDQLKARIVTKDLDSEQKRDLAEHITNIIARYMSYDAKMIVSTCKMAEETESLIKDEDLLMIHKSGKITLNDKEMLACQIIVKSTVDKGRLETLFSEIPFTIINHKIIIDDNRYLAFELIEYDEGTILK